MFCKIETSASVKIAVALKCQRDVQLRAIILCTLQFASFCREAVSQLQQTVLGATHSVLVERVGKILSLLYNVKIADTIWWELNRGSLSAR